MRRIALLLPLLLASTLLAGCPKRAISPEEMAEPDYPDEREDPGVPDGPVPGPGGPDDPRP